MAKREKEGRKLNWFGKIFICSVLIFTITLCFFIFEMKKENEALAIKNQDSSSIQQKGKWKREKKEQKEKKIDSAIVNKTSDNSEERKEVVTPPTHDSNSSEKKKQTDQQSQEQESIAESDEETTEDQTGSQSEDQLEDQTGDQATTQQQLRTGKVVYLTFDDGPHPDSMEILQLLKKYNAKATFFMLEPNMRNYPDAVKQMVQDDHTIAVHGVTHDASKIYKTPASFAGEMETAIQYLEELTNVKTRLIRAPYGSKPYITPPYKAASDAKGFIMWDWNIDSIDWKLMNGQYVQKVIEGTKALEGIKPLVVLLHEKSSTKDHLEKLLKYYSDNGYEMEALTETMEPIQF
ncbi:polysaccharide deacetylase family protein [Bacillus sp. FSL K6-3431]|uniref:polysaccharide deacetylase family protein n=1 Tax=Bacillus sp. FSL K6-3431 TaxID=2921500 RepID=UPI0030F53516